MSADRERLMRAVSLPMGRGGGLSLLTVPHHDFEGGISQGKLLVARELASEVLDIFEELFRFGYPIEKMRLIDEYEPQRTSDPDSLDEASMADNNSSAFCWRNISGTNTLSMHALGRAIDLNPKINPWIRGERVSPVNGGPYADRSGSALGETERRAIIRHGDGVWQAFHSRRWSWGGDWAAPDYQHFEKR